MVVKNDMDKIVLVEILCVCYTVSWSGCRIYSTFATMQTLNNFCRQPSLFIIVALFAAYTNCCNTGNYQPINHQEVGEINLV